MLRVDVICNKGSQLSKGYIVFYTYTGAHSKLGAGEKGAQRKPFFIKRKNDRNQKRKEKRKNAFLDSIMTHFRPSSDLISSKLSHFSL